MRKLARGTVTKILKEHPVHPHKIEYYLERRDPDFEPEGDDVHLGSWGVDSAEPLSG